MPNLPHRIDLSRLESLERMKTRALGASREITDKRNDRIKMKQQAMRERDEALRKVVAALPGAQNKPEILDRNASSPIVITYRQLAARVDELAEEIEQLTSEQAEVNERREAAGGLHAACMSWATENRLIARERNIR